MSIERQDYPGVTRTVNHEFKIMDLKLADIVQCFDGPFGTGTVTHTDDDDFVTVVRPFGVTADFSYTGGVVTYIGQEEIKYSKSSREPIKVYSRKTLR